MVSIISVSPESSVNEHHNCYLKLRECFWIVQMMWALLLTLNVPAAGEAQKQPLPKSHTSLNNSVATLGMVCSPNTSFMLYHIWTHLNKRILLTAKIKQIFQSNSLALSSCRLSLTDLHQAASNFNCEKDVGSCTLLKDSMLRTKFNE